MTLVGCNKKTTAPAPVNAPTSSTASMTAQDSSLLGNWILDKKEYISNGVMMSGYPQNFNDPVNTHIEFKSTPFTLPNGTARECTDGMVNPGFISQTYWYSSSGTVNIGNITMTINLITNSNLILQWGSVNSAGTATDPALNTKKTGVGRNYFIHAIPIYHSLKLMLKHITLVFLLQK